MIYANRKHKMNVFIFWMNVEMQMWWFRTSKYWNLQLTALVYIKYRRYKWDGFCFHVNWSLWVKPHNMTLFQNLQLCLWARETLRLHAAVQYVSYVTKHPVNGNIQSRGVPSLKYVWYSERERGGRGWGARLHNSNNYYIGQID